MSPCAGLTYICNFGKDHVVHHFLDRVSRCPECCIVGDGCVNGDGCGYGVDGMLLYTTSVLTL